MTPVSERFPNKVWEHIFFREETEVPTLETWCKKDSMTGIKAEF